MEDQNESPSLSSLQALASFLREFEAPDFSAGAIVTPPDENSVFQSPYARYTSVVGRFQQEAYDRGWVLRNFDWFEWTKTEEAQRLRSDKGAVEHASASQLAKLLTACILT